MSDNMIYGASTQFPKKEKPRLNPKQEAPSRFVTVTLNPNNVLPVPAPTQDIPAQVLDEKVLEETPWKERRRNKKKEDKPENDNVADSN